MEKFRRHYVFYGRVQGVGFRYNAKYAASAYGITGWVHNRYDGAVEMEAQGSKAEHQEMLNQLTNARFIDITDIDVKEIPLVDDERGFRVV
ncbi:MAG: acylphosphatase [Lachnospiraceae bacterium]|nr:acylphosphatase [Lachnospiraceae bacterium]